MSLSQVKVETLQAERAYTVCCTCKVMKLSTCKIFCKTQNHLQRHCQAEQSWQLVCRLAVDLVWRCQVLQLKWGSKQVSGCVWYSYMYSKTSSMWWHVHCKHSQHANTKSKHSAVTQMRDVIDTSFASCLLACQLKEYHKVCDEPSEYNDDKEGRLKSRYPMIG